MQSQKIIVLTYYLQPNLFANSFGELFAAHPKAGPSAVYRSGSLRNYNGEMVQGCAKLSVHRIGEKCQPATVCVCVCVCVCVFKVGGCVCVCVCVCMVGVCVCAWCVGRVCV